MNIESVIRNKVTEDGDYGNGDSKELFHPSSAGYCPRQMFISKKGLWRPVTRIKGAMKVGTIIHDWFEKNLEFPVEVKKEVNLKYDPSGYDVYWKGRCDLFDVENGVVLDYKTISRLSQLTPEYSAKHRDQLQIYMKALNVTDAEIVYVTKTCMDTKTISFKRDDERIEKLNRKAQEVYEALDVNPTKKKEIPFSKCRCYQCRNELIGLE